MIDLQNPLTGKVAFVTGGGTGIGKATATLLAERGAKVVVAGPDEARLAEAVRAVEAAGGEGLAVVVDVSVEASIAAGIAATIERFGRLDILHSNAARQDQMQADGYIAEMDAAVWDAAMAVNLRGAMLCSKHAIPHMLAAGGGSIIFTGSGKGVAGDLDFPAYGTTKAGLIALARYIATQYGKKNIRANTLVVGLVMTEALDANMPPEAQKLMLEHNLTPELGKPRDIAEVVAFLASDQSRYITGSALVVDGGFTAHSAVHADAVRFAAMAAGQQS